MSLLLRLVYSVVSREVSYNSTDCHTLHRSARDRVCGACEGDFNVCL